jgi:multidrug efflux pump
VQAAINATRADLPATLRSNPTYRKANPSAAPVIILALTSPTRSPGQIYDAVSNLVQQKIAQVQASATSRSGGGSQPAVRIELAPYALNRYGIATEDVRAALQASSANRPKGEIELEGKRLQIYTGRQRQQRSAADYRGWWWPGATARGAPAGHRRGDRQRREHQHHRPVQRPAGGHRAGDAAARRQRHQDRRRRARAAARAAGAAAQGRQAVEVASDRTNSIRSALHEVELTLVIAILLVVLVVSVSCAARAPPSSRPSPPWCRCWAPSAVMYLLGFSLNNLSLMALTVATGFVVDDAIVVLENTARHIEAGMDRFQAALLGAREVGFTVLSISLSLVAVFIPLLFMGGQVGRLFREFAVTLSAAVLISLVISLTTTPMMCAWLLRPGTAHRKPGLHRAHHEGGFGSGCTAAYALSLDWALRRAGWCC